MDYLITNEILEDPDITGRELIIYCVLQSLFYSTDYDTTLFNYGSIHYALTGETEIRPCDRVNYIAALESLSDKGYIAVEPLTKGRYILSIRHFDIQEGEFFTRINIRNIIRLYKIYKSKAYSLCKQYLYILKVIGDRHYYDIKISDIAYYTGLSTATISSNNVLLNKSGLLHILFTTKPNYYNTYGKPEYRDEINALGEKRNITQSSNKRRSITAKYNVFKATGHMDLVKAERLLADMKHEEMLNPAMTSKRWDIKELEKYIAELKANNTNPTSNEDDDIEKLFLD